MIIIPFDLYSFLCGPAFVFSILLFTGGCLYRIFQFMQMTRKLNRASYNPPHPVLDNRSILFSGKTVLRKISIYLKLKIKRTIFGINPVMGAVSAFFHTLLFFTPFFLSAHNILVDQYTGISLFSLPDQLMDKLTVLLIIICLFFLFRRFFILRVRILTTVSDYFVLLLVMLPFITALIAYHQLFNYKISLFMHIISGEIAIITIPFTKLGHMPFFIFSRFFVSGEYNSKYANRTW
jgi:nitrate reductase gamma subunit